MGIRGGKTKMIMIFYKGQCLEYISLFKNEFVQYCKFTVFVMQIHPNRWYLAHVHRQNKQIEGFWSVFWWGRNQWMAGRFLRLGSRPPHRSKFIEPLAVAIYDNNLIHFVFLWCRAVHLFYLFVYYIFYLFNNRY
jgi:hypothetical protein